MISHPDITAFPAEGNETVCHGSSLATQSLQGGTLVQTPLYAANGDVYAVAQGPVSVGGFTAGGGGTSVTKNHVTVARIPEGAIVEKPVKSEFSDAQGLSVLLHTPDFTTARRVADAINEKLGADSASAQNAACVRVNTALASPDDAVAVIAQIGALDVRQDDVARVIVTKRPGRSSSSKCHRGPHRHITGNLGVEIATSTTSPNPRVQPTGATGCVPRDSVMATETRRLPDNTGGHPRWTLVRR